MAEIFRSFHKWIPNSDSASKKLYILANFRFCALFFIILKISAILLKTVIIRICAFILMNLKIPPIFRKMGQKWLKFYDLLKIQPESAPKKLYIPTRIRFCAKPYRFHDTNVLPFYSVVFDIE